jgi:hypothetical protein
MSATFEGSFLTKKKKIRNGGLNILDLHSLETYLNAEIENAVA